MKDKRKIIVITGASGGVGAALCHEFLENGWKVIGVCRKQSLIPPHVQKSMSFRYIQSDISSYESVKKCFETISQYHESIDVLINNAAVFKSAPFAQTTLGDVDSIIDTNLKGTIYCTMQAIPMISRGRIISISSVAGKNGFPNQTLYCASKHGINGFFDALGKELAANGILVSTISPAGINTKLWNDGNPYRGDVNQLLRPIDIAKLAYYIATQLMDVVITETTIKPIAEI